MFLKNVMPPSSGSKDKPRKQDNSKKRQYSAASIVRAKQAMNIVFGLFFTLKRGEGNSFETFTKLHDVAS
jgi:hypothetical protein